MPKVSRISRASCVASRGSSKMSSIRREPCSAAAARHRASRVSGRVTVLSIGGTAWARPLLHDRPDGAAVDQSDEASVDLDRVAEGDHGATQDALGVQVRAELAQQVVEQLLLGCVTLQLRLGFLQLLDRVVEVGGRVLTDALGSDPGPAVRAPDAVPAAPPRRRRQPVGAGSSPRSPKVMSSRHSSAPSWTHWRCRICTCSPKWVAAPRIMPSANPQSRRWER